MTPILLAAVLAAAAAGLAAPSRSAATRLRSAAGATDRSARTAPARPAASSPAARRCAAGLVGVAVALLVGGFPIGALMGAIAAIAAERFLARLEPLALRRRRLAVSRDLPVALDLLAACLAGDIPLDQALRAVATGVGGPIAEELGVVLAAVELGAAGEAWSLLRDPQLTPVGRVFARGNSSGAPVAETATALADDQRATARIGAEEAARRASVASVAPLGACFLPAFVLTAVVPVVAGLAEHVLS